MKLKRALGDATSIGAVVAIVGFWALSVAASLAIPIGLVWAGIHFIRKFW